MPFAIRIHLAVSLVGLLSLGYYLSPAMDLHADLPGVLLGAVMVLVAIGMATGWHARPAALLLVAAGIPFNATLFFFGNVELVGHLPVYGTMLALLVNGSDPGFRPLVSEWWPWGADLRGPGLRGTWRPSTSSPSRSGAG